MDKQAEEQAVSSNDLSLQNAAQRRRKRRKQAKSSSGAAQKKLDQHFRADDRAAGQGIHADKRDDTPRARPASTKTMREETPRTTTQHVPQNLVATLANLPEVRDIGRKLNQAESEANQAQAALDQQRQQEQQQQEGKKPLNEQSFQERTEQQQQQPSNKPDKPRRK